MRISDWSSDVCSSDLCVPARCASRFVPSPRQWWNSDQSCQLAPSRSIRAMAEDGPQFPAAYFTGFISARSEEHTSELQSLMRISYAVFCLKKKKDKKIKTAHKITSTAYPYRKDKQ